MMSKVLRIAIKSNINIYFEVPGNPFRTWV